MRKLLLIVPVTAALGAACSEGPSGPNVKIQVGALELPGVGRVCYDLAVENGNDETVWSKGDPDETSAEGDDDTVCSDQYGNSGGGDITYIGTCDASEPEHTVRLWVDTLESTGGAVLDDWVDPCPDTGCELEVTCVENADTLVAFDITIMRRAQQGFFDVAVNFEDIFCSAKVDCTYDDAGTDPIELLFRDGERAQTAVIGFACSAGADENATLLVSPPFVECDAGTGTIASIVMNSWPNGDLVGYEVVPNGGPDDVVLNPVMWSRTASGWGAPSLLPIPGYNSAVPHSRVDDTRLIGEAFDTDGNGDVSSIVLWQWDGSAWQIEATALTDLNNSSSGIVTVWDPTFDRVFLGDGDIVNSYWDLSAGWLSDGPRRLPIDHDACVGRSAIGDNVAFSCFDEFNSDHVFALDLGTGEIGELPQQLGELSSRRVFENLTALSDGSIVGVLYAPDEGLRGLHHWQLADGSWSGSLIGAATSDVTVQWRDGDYFFVSRDGGVPELHYMNGGHETWTTATVDGETPDGWTLQGAVELGGAAYVYGLAAVAGAPVWVAGVVVAGETIALHTLPSPIAPSEPPLFVLGKNAGKVWLSGVSLDDGVRVVWQLDAAEPTLVADWRIVAPGLPIPSEFIFSGTTEGPPNTVSTFGGIDDLDRAFGFAPFASGSTGSTVQAVALQMSQEPSPGGELALDPTVDGNGWKVDEDPMDPVWQYAAYRGREQLRCGAGSCNKVFWNFAIGFEPRGRSCRLRFVGTALGEEFFESGPPQEGLLRYPYVNVDVQLTDADGAMVCRRNPLDGESSGVTSQYTSFDGSDDTVALCFGYDGQSTQSYCGF